MRLLVLTAVLSPLFLFSACHSSKGSARMYEGDAPSIRYTESHAGGPLRGN